MVLIFQCYPNHLHLTDVPTPGKIKRKHLSFGILKREFFIKVFSVSDQEFCLSMRMQNMNWINLENKCLSLDYMKCPFLEYLIQRESECYKTKPRSHGRICAMSVTSDHIFFLTVTFFFELIPVGNTQYHVVPIHVRGFSIATISYR